MKKDRKSRRRSEEGIALLIAIFVLLLISVVAIALLVSSGTETALGKNYRSSATVYYAALAGLEEARGRLLPKNPNYFGPSVIPSGTSLATALPLGQAVYVVNANSYESETVAPWNSSNLYFDTEYQSEFGVPASSWQSVTSVWNNNAQGIPGPIYKWARINAVTEQSLYMDINQDGVYDSSTLIFYDPAHVNSSGVPMPSLIVSTSPPSTAVQALEITALAYLPNGSKKILQYLVAPATVSVTFPAALTMDGYSDLFNAGNYTLYNLQGNRDTGDPACGGPTTPFPVFAIGVPDNADIATVEGGIPVSKISNYQGLNAPPYPSVGQVPISSNLQTVQSLNSLVQYITQNADAVIQGPATQAQLPSAMSASNLMTVVIAGDPTQPTQGNLTLTSPGTNPGPSGYGLLVVTGTLNYTTDWSWNGIILVIGQGIMTGTAPGDSTTGTFTGAVLVAQTRDSSGNLLAGPAPGPATFTNGGGQGIIYNCSSIKAAQAPLTYKVLSFHEIPQ